MEKKSKQRQLNRFETEARERGFSVIAGVDEAGRGPLAGPVVAAACILPPHFSLPQIDDSKQLSEKEREAIFELLMKDPEVSYATAAVDALLIDQINILRATLQAMAAAIALLNPPPDLVLIDGIHAPKIKTKCQTIIKGDTLSQSIMAAAIIAKVTRDRQMRNEYHSQWPEYGFASHKGYGTKRHLQALDQFGPCPIHRKTFAPVRTLVMR